MVGEWKDLPQEIKDDCAEVCPSCAALAKPLERGQRRPDTGPFVLDEDGVLATISGKPGWWQHTWDDGWWECKAAKIIDRAGEVRGTQER